MSTGGLLEPQVVERFRRMYVGLIVDACDHLIGVASRRFMDPAIRPIHKAIKIVGQAYTVLQAPARRGTGLVGTFEAAEVASPGQVIVVAGGMDEVAMWGEMLSIRCKSRGIEGAVVDGGCRDVPFIEQMGFPLFFRTFAPTSAQPRVDTVAHGVPVECGGVLVEPGDLVFGDLDGICVVPRGRILDVLAFCEEKAAEEEEVRSRLRSGKSLYEISKDFKVL